MSFRSTISRIISAPLKVIGTVRRTCPNGMNNITRMETAWEEEEEAVVVEEVAVEGVSHRMTEMCLARMDGERMETGVQRETTGRRRRWIDREGSAVLTRTDTGGPNRASMTQLLCQTRC